MTAYSDETCKLLRGIKEKEKKLDQRAQAFFVEDYVHNLFIHQAECCVIERKMLSLDV